jgi:putative glycosyltransferase (TIGR04348 family)
MKILMVTPAPPSLRNGNRMTALRWARILRRLGHQVRLTTEYTGQSCDLMVALHARRSAWSIERFHERYPQSPLIVVLTGTDLYRDIHVDAAAKKSLEIATRLVVLQSMALKKLPRRLHAKTRVIYQSAFRVDGHASERDGFRVCVIGHLRREKDPMRTAMAVRHLPAASRVKVVHVGRALEKELGNQATRENRTNPRYRWIGELPNWKTRKVLAGSHLLCVTSLMEGSSNVLSEALASSVPVVASKIPGLEGTLGRDYPGYFRVGDTRGLAHIIRQAECDRAFYKKLKASLRRLSPLIDPRRERDSFRALLREVTP